MSKSIFQGMKTNPALYIGGGITILLLMIAVTAVFWTPHSHESISIINRFKSFTSSNWLGTDQLGRDMLSVLMKGAQYTMLISISSVLLGMFIGVPLGCLAASTKKWDRVVVPAGDFIFAFPALITAIIIMTISGPGAFNAIISIGLFNIPVFMRMSRSSSTVIWKQDFVEIAKVVGKSRLRIAFEHILPNISHIIFTQAAIQLAMAIIAESGLSYLGLSLQPPEPTWGKMLYDSQTYFRISPWLAVLPGLTITISVLSLNLLASGLQEYFDSKLDYSR